MRAGTTSNRNDPVAYHPYLLSKEQRFKDPDDTLKLVIVRDMWLTGFDVPSLHTMYVDKPTQGHGLMQAITRVNRVFRDKDGGLIVNYLGIAHNLGQVLSVYTERGRLGGREHNADRRRRLGHLTGRV